MTAFETDFRNYQRDIDRWMERNGGTRRLSSGAQVRTGLDRATTFMLDLYFARQAYDPLTEMFGATADALQHPVFARLHKALLTQRDLPRLRRLWASALATQKAAFWEMWSFCRAKGPYYEDATHPALLARDKQRLLETLTQFAELMRGFGDQASADAALQTRGRIEREERGKTLGKPHERAMDEDVFWGLVETAAQDAEPAAWADRLTDALEGFKPGEISKFEKRLQAQMAMLDTWDVLALAHLALSGVSDDTFEYFRAWLIFQGRQVCATAARDVETLAGRIGYGGGQVEGLASVAANAYENRCGKPLKPLKAKARSTAGAPWEPADLPLRYPRLHAALGSEAAI